VCDHDAVAAGLNAANCVLPCTQGVNCASVDAAADIKDVSMQEYVVLAESNEGLQQRARQVLDLRNKGRPVVSGGLSQLEGADTRYRCETTTEPL
jgi:hypothetical protein